MSRRAQEYLGVKERKRNGGLYLKARLIFGLGKYWERIAFFPVSEHRFMGLRSPVFTGVIVYPKSPTSLSAGKISEKKEGATFGAVHTG